MGLTWPWLPARAPPPVTEPPKKLAELAAWATGPQDRPRLLRLFWWAGRCRQPAPSPPGRLPLVAPLLAATRAQGQGHRGYADLADAGAIFGTGFAPSRAARTTSGHLIF